MWLHRNGHRRMTTRPTGQLGGQSGGANAVSGFVWQAYQALNQLFKEDVAAVVVEGCEDIVVCHAKQNAITAVQAKHHTGEATLTPGTTDLWKTIRNWLELEAGPNPPTRYSLLTTSTASSTLTVLTLPADRRAAAETDLVVAALDKAGAGNVKEPAVQTGRTLWRNLRPEAKTKFLQKCQVDDRANDLETINGELAAILIQRFHSDDNAEFIAESLQRWFLGQSLPLAGSATKEKKEITAKQAFDEYYRCRALCEADVPDPQFGDHNAIPPMPDEAMYVKQLRAIAVASDELLHAHKMFVKARLERDMIVKHDRGLGWMKGLRINLQNAWAGHHAAAGRLGTSEQEQGRGVYDRCRNVAGHIGKRAAATHEVEGNFHDLANEQHLGWHPKWKEV